VMEYSNERALVYKNLASIEEYKSKNLKT
jgi:hypothetical protein